MSSAWSRILSRLLLQELAELRPPACRCALQSAPSSWDSPANGPPENAGGSAEVEGAPAWVGVHPLAQEALVLHLLAHKPAGDGDLLAADHHLRPWGRPKALISTIGGYCVLLEASGGSGAVRGALTTCWPERICLATTEARRPSMWARASMTTACSSRSEGGGEQAAAGARHCA